MMGRLNSVSLVLLVTFHVPAHGQAPVTDSELVVDTIHGRAIADPYRWLERLDGPTVEWIARQNAYTDSVLGALDFREELGRTLRTFSSSNDDGILDPPLVQGGRLFVRVRGAHGSDDMSIRDERTGMEIARVTGDADARLSPPIAISPGGSLVAHGIRAGGPPTPRIVFFDVRRGRYLPDTLPAAAYRSIVLADDPAGAFYVRRTPEGPRVRFHRFGDPVSNDRSVFGEEIGDLTSDMSLHPVDDGRWFVIRVWKRDGATSLYGIAAAPGSSAWTIVEDVEASFDFGAADGRMFIATTWEAPNWRVLVAAGDGRAPTEVVPNLDLPATRFTAAGGKLGFVVLDSLRPVLRLYEPNGRRSANTVLPGFGAVSELLGDWDSPTLYYAYTSWTQPRTIYRYDLDSREQTVWSTREAAVDLSQLVTRQVWYTSTDGTQIPLLMVQRQGLSPTGDVPVRLHVYGGFASPNPPRYSMSVAAWAMAGGIFAKPAVRGGGELGWEWYEAGRGANKQKTIDDVIAAVQWFVDEGYTTPSKISIEGSSNGGFVTLAAITQRPDLLAAAVSEYPPTDLLRVPDDPRARRIVQSSGMVMEWGDRTEPDHAARLAAYSPYHQVRDGVAYPAILLVSGQHDPMAWDDRKMAARLQMAAAGEAPILFRHHGRGGHGGAGLDPDTRWRDLLDQESFLYWRLGVRPTGPESR